MQRSIVVPNQDPKYNAPLLFQVVAFRPQE
jgi:hypothetical protein